MEKRAVSGKDAKTGKADKYFMYFIQGFFHSISTLVDVWTTLSNSDHAAEPVSRKCSQMNVVKFEQVKSYMQNAIEPLLLCCGDDPSYYLKQNTLLAYACISVPSGRLHSPHTNLTYPNQMPCTL